MRVRVLLVFIVSFTMVPTGKGNRAYTLPNQTKRYRSFTISEVGDWNVNGKCYRHFNVKLPEATDLIKYKCPSTKSETNGGDFLIIDRTLYSDKRNEVIDTSGCVRYKITTDQAQEYSMNEKDCTHIKNAIAKGVSVKTLEKMEKQEQYLNVEPEEQDSKVAQEERDRIAQEERDREIAQERARIAEAQDRERARIAQEERDREAAQERDRIAQEKRDREAALERARIAKEAQDREAAQERDRIAQEKREREAAQERYRIEKEKRDREAAQERDRIAQEKRDREAAQERDRIAQEKRDRKAAEEWLKQEKERLNKQEIDKQKLRGPETTLETSTLGKNSRGVSNDDPLQENNVKEKKTEKHFFLIEWFLMIWQSLFGKQTN
ncbi:uncharacterized protein LOC128993593 [Macrosteles quadrilineatus]|uniref:uncharacterized protein LOC128993593 n=1 Tax=Macrosteles quadrilineatus TaxID=74068 RepID=UPI0023E137EF|nr:uncharacterized protein LOC128993593 [Macrosteles quadrilineatus]